MDLQLNNKKAFVSGSASGIGYTIAKLLAKEGAKVVINGLEQSHIDEALKNLKQEVPSAKVSGLVADFADVEQVEKLAGALDQIDILINNVGVFTSQPFDQTSDEDWFRLFNINVMSGVRLSRKLMPSMLDRNWGRIIFISSECAMLVPEDLIAYSASKAAVLAISRGLAQTAKGTNVTVNSILPGSTLSQGAKNFLQEAAEKEGISEKEVADNFFKDVRTSSLVSRFLDTEEVANLAVYLSSPLSAGTTGASLKVDGGSVPGIL